MSDPEKPKLSSEIVNEDALKRLEALQQQVDDLRERQAAIEAALPEVRDALKALTEGKTADAIEDVDELDALLGL